jgi:hypothetical protein
MCPKTSTNVLTAVMIIAYLIKASSFISADSSFSLRLKTIKGVRENNLG